MDDRYFDQLTRAMSRGATRRMLLKVLFGFAAMPALAVVHDTEAARRGYGGPASTTEPGPAPSIEIGFRPPANGQPGVCQPIIALNGFSDGVYTVGWYVTANGESGTTQYVRVPSLYGAGLGLLGSPYPSTGDAIFHASTNGVSTDSAPVSC